MTSPLMQIPAGEAHAELAFHRPFVTGNEAEAMSRALATGFTAGNGPAAHAVEQRLAELLGSEKVLLTHSCTGALELSALLADVGPGDEVIMPSFTFVSTASAFALRGAVPVFVEVRPGDLCLDPEAVAAAVTPRTKAIVPVHYAGGAADMEALTNIAAATGALVIEDAAQSAFARWRGRAPGGIGQLGAMSFHETKNLSCGEGGALFINDPAFIDRAEILQEKGTNRMRFTRGEIASYQWVDIGSSFLMSDLTAAILDTQLEVGRQVTDARRAIWAAYHENLAPLEQEGYAVLPHLAPDVECNGHIFWMLAPTQELRDAIIVRLRTKNIRSQFHYVPLHSAPAGMKYGRVGGDLSHTSDAASRLLRLPVWAGMTRGDVERVLDEVTAAFRAVVRVPVAA